MRSLILIAVLLSSALAGCADETPPVSQDEFAYDGELSATESTGVIRGVVVDASVTPLAGVMVTGTDMQAITDGRGTFGFGDMEPGNHCLTFAKTGYFDVSVCHPVEAGVAEPAIVRVMMELNPEDIVEVIPYKFDGMVKCGLSYIAACGAADIVGQDVGDRFMYTQELEAGAPTHITMEAVWTGSQPTGDNFQLRLGHTPAGPGTVDATATGPSPQQAVVNETQIQAAGIGAGNDLVGRMFVWEMEGTNIQDHTGQCVYVVLTTWCHGPGAALDQKFQIFTHAFYGYAPPADWRFTDDEPPRPPQ